MDKLWNDEQNKTILNELKKMGNDKKKDNKAYIITFYLLDKNNKMAYYSVRSNDRTRLAQHHGHGKITEETYNEVKNDIRRWINLMLDDLLEVLCENEVIVKRITVRDDGSIC